MGATIFVIDNSPAVRRMVEQISAPEGYEVIGFQDGPTALEAARRISPAMIIADYHLDHMTFAGFCKEIGKLDNLTETSIISLIDASDRLDESHLRSLGVKGFLKKPFQSDHLLEAMKDLANGLSKNGLHPAVSKKKRTWPPDSMTTDLDDEDATTTALACDASDGAESAEEPPMIPSASALTSTTTPAGSPAPQSARGEDAVKGFFDHLLHSVSQEAEAKIVDLVPAVIAKELSLQVAKAVAEEVSRQVEISFSPDRIKAIVRDMIVEELPKHATSYLSALDSTVKQTLSEMVPPLVEQSSERLIRQQIESVLEKHVPGAVRNHLGPVEVLVKNEVQQVVSQCARQTTEDLVREIAQEPIQQAVRKVIPEIAETQVKEEIKRLTAQT